MYLDKSLPPVQGKERNRAIALTRGTPKIHYNEELKMRPRSGSLNGRALLKNFKLPLVEVAKDAAHMEPCSQRRKHPCK